MRDPAIDRIRVDVVSPADLEPAISVRVDGADGVAEGAADVDVDVVAGDDQPGIVTAPGPGDIGDGRRGRGRARDGG